MRAKLIKKDIDILITRNLREKFRLPQRVVFYDDVKGSSESKGNFEIFTFKDKNGKIVCRTTNYEANNRVKTVSKKFVYRKEDDMTEIHTVIKEDNKKIEEEYRVLYGKNEFGKILMTREILTDNGDEHIMTSLLGGHKPKSISYVPQWDGNIPDFRYVNIQNKTLNCDDLEYLPIILSEQSKCRNKQKARHLARYNEKMHNIQGVAPEPQIVPLRELNVDTNYTVTGDCDCYTGQVRVCRGAMRNAYSSIEAFAHEYQHLSDLSDTIRLKSIYEDYRTKFDTPDYKEFFDANPEIVDFVKKSAKRGIIDDETEEGKLLKKINDMIESYNETKTLKEHDEEPFEIRAIEKEQEEVNKLDKLLNNVVAFLEED